MENNVDPFNDPLELVKDIREMLATSVMAVSVIVLTSLTSCTKEQQVIARSVIDQADKGSQLGCILLPSLPVQGKDKVEDVCLAAAEIREAVADYQRGKAARLAAASASAAPPAASSAPVHAPAPPSASSALPGPAAAPSASAPKAVGR